MNEIGIISIPNLPPATSAYANKVYRLVQPGVDDVFYVCKREAAGTWIWVDINATGGGGGYITAVSDTATIDLTVAGTTLSAVALFGTGAGQVAEGNHTHTGVYSLIGHTHANDHVAATVLDTASIDLTLSGQQISAAAKVLTGAKLPSPSRSASERG